MRSEVGHQRAQDHGGDENDRDGQVDPQVTDSYRRESSPHRPITGSVARWEVSRTRARPRPPEASTDVQSSTARTTSAIRNSRTRPSDDPMTLTPPPCPQHLRMGCGRVTFARALERTESRGSRSGRRDGPDGATPACNHGVRPYPSGAENAVTSCDLHVLVHETAEPVASEGLDRCAGGRGSGPCGRVLIERSVWTVRVVVLEVLV